MTSNSLLKTQKNLSDIVHQHYEGSRIYIARPAWCWNVIDKNQQSATFHYQFQASLDASDKLAA